MDPLVESALISAAATLVGVGGTATVAIVAFRHARKTNRETIEAAKVNTDTQVNAALAANRETIDRLLEAQLTDRYVQAIEQLGCKELDVRIGGIYALERIARDSARDHPTVMEVLTAIIREHSREPLPSSDASTQDLERSTRPDVQAAVTVIGRRETKQDIRPIDLHGSNLAGANLSDANLAAANLAAANLSDANLAAANLADANLAAANLADAILTDANLSGAILGGTDLTGAFLGGADLASADLRRADLTHANLFRADLADASLTDADISGTNLASATLTGAFLVGARLRGARWPPNVEVPEGWQQDAISGVLTEAGTDSEPPEAN
jgi:uncharacterized protein YjbI with pentapeptide repeats